MADSKQRRRGPTPAQMAARAASELTELVGREPEGVVSLESEDGRWRVGVEILEVRRVPDTADILAEYQVELDEHGALLGYRRVRRYSRGRAGERE
jgi:hypothetical protein